MTIPLILDTDIGGCAGGAIALTIAALTVDNLALVITSDECAGQRARAARHLLDVCGRRDVLVVTGADLGNRDHCHVTGLVPAHVPSQPVNTLDAIAATIVRHHHVSWVAIGPMTNLADLLDAYPELARRITLTLAGGTFTQLPAGRAEHHFARDSTAARTVLAAVRRPQLIPGDLAYDPVTAIWRTDRHFQRLRAGTAPAWARLLAAHADAWFDATERGIMLQDPLALSAALGLPHAGFTPAHIRLDGSDQISHTATGGYAVDLAHHLDTTAFHTWINQQLRPTHRY